MSLRWMVCLLVALCLVVSAAWAEQDEPYRNHAQVRVFPDTPELLKALYRMHFDIVPSENPMEPFVFAYPEDLLRLEQEGYRYEIIHENVEQFYAQRLASPVDSLMGGYRTLWAINMKLDSLHNQHSNIVTAKFSIGQTLQGRDMYVIKISDNPDVDEDEPEVFLNSLIHAREPEPMECLFYFADYLVNNYGTNPDVTYLLDNREIFILPCVNPDGYEYNHQTNPGGGGMWRKNRRNNGGSYGVDCNRNFGLAWGIDDNGSSPIPSDETYRGPSAFSELETQHIRDFVNSRHFVTQLDYHSVASLVLYPWGTSYYDGDGLTVDNATFSMMADSMANLIHSVNGVWYATGTAWQTLYNVNGGSFDWEYGDQTSHSKIYAFTIEVSGSGFWPAPSEIIPIAQENLPAELYMCHMAGVLAPMPYQVMYQGQCEAEWNGNGNGAIEPSEGFTLAVTLKNSGTQSLANLQGLLSTADPYVTIVQANSNWPVLNSNQSGVNSTLYQVTIAANCPAPHVVPLSLHLTDAAGLDTSLSLNGTVGTYTIVDNVEGGVGGWTTGGSNNQWHISTRRAQSPTHAWFSGAEAGNYADNMNAYLLSTTLILGPGAELSYDQWYNLESGYDYGRVEINTGGGWTQIGTPVTGSSGAWVPVTTSLGLTCPGTLVQIRFRMTSDANTNAEGWYIDNINTGCAIPADIAVSPASVTGVAPMGGTDSETLQICNQGACPMTWSIAFNQITPAFSTNVSSPAVQLLAVPDMDASAEDISKGSFERSGRDQLDASGGPDAFGYRWRDSAEPGGPAYSWVELASIGTPLTFTTDDQIIGVNLPWNWSFYGTSYNTARVSANGNLHFSADTTDFGNRQIPHGRLPNAMMAVLWDDLSPQLAGASVWTYNDVANSRFIVQYDSVPHYNNTGNYTFEVILYQTGRIVYQYQSVTGLLTSLSIGIENATGTVGLQVVYNAAYLANNVAIEFWNQVPWLTFGSPTSGSLNPGQCSDVTLNFAAGSLAAGTYDGQLIIQSTDPDENPLNVPVSFLVGLIPPANFTVYYQTATNELSFRWVTNGAPQYKVYSSTSDVGPFDTLVGTTTGGSLTIPMPPELRLHYVVVASE